MSDLKKLFLLREHEWDNPPQPQSGMDPNDVDLPGGDRPGTPPRWMSILLSQVKLAVSDLEVAIGSQDTRQIGKLGAKLAHLAGQFSEGSEP
jgi:hypothetical protein